MEDFAHKTDWLLGGVDLLNEDEHVVHISFHIVAQLLLKDMVDQPLVGWPGVFQPEGHDFVAIHKVVYVKGYCVFIGRVHLDLAAP